MKNQKIKKILYTSALIGSVILLIVSVVYFLSVIINFRADLTETTESLSLQMAKDAANEINVMLEKEHDNCSLLAEEILKAIAKTGKVGEDVENVETGETEKNPARTELETLLWDYGTHREHQKYISDVSYFYLGQEFRCDTSYANSEEGIATPEFYSTEGKDDVTSKSVKDTLKSTIPVFSGIYELGIGEQSLIPTFVFWYPLSVEDFCFLFFSSRCFL